MKALWVVFVVGWTTVAIQSQPAPPGPVRIPSAEPLKVAPSSPGPAGEGSNAAPMFSRISRPGNDPTDEALDLYAEMTGRTVLRPSVLPLLAASLRSELPVDTNAAIAFIAAELATNRIELVPDGDKFVRVLRAGSSNSPVAAQLARLKPPPPPAPGVVISTGAIALRSVDLSQVLMIYSELRRCTVLRPPTLPSPAIRFRNQKPLTPEETIYGFNVVLALNGIAVVDDGDKFVQVVPVGQVLQLRTRAPKPDKGAPLMDPGTVPVFGRKPALLPKPPVPAKPLTLRDRFKQGYSWAYKKVVGHPPPGPRPPGTTVDELVAYYAKLVGRKAVPSKKFGARPIVFEVRTALTKAEVLYGIEATLALDSLAIVPVDDKSVRVEHLSGYGPSDRKSPVASQP